MNLTATIHRTLPYLQIYIFFLSSLYGILCSFFFSRSLIRFPFGWECNAFCKMREGEWLKLMAFIYTDRDRLNEYEFSVTDMCCLAAWR